MTKHSMVLAAAVFMLAACDNSVNGTINVAQTFPVTTTNGAIVDIGVGTYASTLTMKSSKTLEIAFKLGGAKELVRIQLPKNASLPTDGNGQFVIKGDEVGTSFDINGSLATVVTNGPQQQGFATCLMQPPPPVCFPTPQGTVCTGSSAPTQGIQTVITHVQTTTVTAMADFSQSTSSAHLASFNGRNTSTEEVYDYQGICHY